MGNILNRLLQIARAESLNRVHRLGARLVFEHLADQFFTEDRFSGSDSSDNSNTKRQRFKNKDFQRRSPGVPHQVCKDLEIFNLKPPSSLEEVKKARNREFKKYHSDRFMNNPEKYQTSKEIMQIYNAAYERLTSYYQKRQHRS
jgi:hypothetical protein